MIFFVGIRTHRKASAAIPGLASPSGSTSARPTLEDLQREPTIYLVPECDSEDQAIECLGENVSDIFEEHLDGWYRVPRVWPTKRDLTRSDAGLSLAFTP